MAASGFLQRYLAAVQMHTRVPINGAWALPAGQPLPNFGTTAAHFPGVGWITGIVACAVFAGLSLLLPNTGFSALAAAVGCIVATVLLTGGAHESALAELADLGEEMGARLDPGHIPPIVRHKPIGAAGVIAIVLAVALKLALLAVLASHSPGAVLTALVVAQVVSRGWPVLLLGGLVTEGRDRRLDRWSLAVAFGWCVPPVAAAVLAQGANFTLAAVLLSGMPLLGLRWVMARRLRGFAIDRLGAAQQLCELGFYLGAAIALGLRL